MTVGEAKNIARQWVEKRAAELPAQNTGEHHEYR